MKRIQKRKNLNVLLRISLTLAGQHLFGQWLDFRIMGRYAEVFGFLFLEMMNVRKAK